MKQEEALKRNDADGVQVGDIVRFSHRGVQSGIPWRVIEVRKRKIQHYWGFWYRELVLQSTSSKRITTYGTWEVDVIGQAKP